MRFLAVVALILLGSASAQAAPPKKVPVRPQVRRNGTYVQPHYRTSPNRTRTDNWSSKGNVNPYTGKPGKVDPYKPKK